MPFNAKKMPKKPAPEKVTDLTEEDRKNLELYRLWGSQNPPVRTRRGRVFD